MFKNRKRTLSLVLVSVLMISLFAGCGVIRPKPTPDSLIGFASETLKGIESEDVTLGIYVDLSSEDDEYSSVNATVEIQAKLHHKSETSHMIVSGDMYIDGKRSKHEIETYLVEEDDWVTYKKDTVDGKSSGWILKDGKSSLDIEIPTTLLLDLIEEENANLVLDEELVRYNDNMCYVVSCLLDDVSEILDLYEIDDLIGIEYDDVNAKIQLYFDAETKYLRGLQIDFKEAVKTLFEEDEVSVDIEDMAITVAYNSINDLKTIKVPKSVKKEIEESNTEPPTETVPVVPDNTEPIEPNEPIEPELPDREPPANGESFSQDWTDLDIKIDGTVYHFPYDYDLLTAKGWSFDLADYGHENGYVLKSNEYIYSTINLNNPKYGTKFDSAEITVGFKNYSETAQDILECDVWALKIRRVYGVELIEDYPEVELAGGISWGATKEEVIDAYGTWNDIYESENGYIKVTYINDYNQYMELTIYDDYGLAEVSLKSYEK